MLMSASICFNRLTPDGSIAKKKEPNVSWKSEDICRGVQDPFSYRLQQSLISQYGAGGCDFDFPELRSTEIWLGTTTLRTKLGQKTCRRRRQTTGSTWTPATGLSSPSSVR